MVPEGCDCTMHMRNFTILQGSKFYIACIPAKFGGSGFVSDIQMKYSIW